MNKLLNLFLFAVLAFGLSQFLMRQNQRTLQEKTIIRLTMWNVPPKSLPLDRQIWEETVKEFEAANPGIKVEGVEREYRPEEFITVMALGRVFAQGLPDEIAGNADVQEIYLGVR